MTTNNHTTTKQATGEALRAGASFVVYVRTLQFFAQRLRGDESDKLKPVHIPQKEIENRFFVHPHHVRKVEIDKLIRAGELAVHKEVSDTGRQLFKYEALKPGPISFEYVRPRGLELDEVTRPMLRNLEAVSLPYDAPSTFYFSVFLKVKCQCSRVFFTVDTFAGRVHTPITNFHRTHRPNLLLHGERTVSLDVATMQPLLLGKILMSEIGENDFSRWINEGRDVYEYLQEVAKLKTRDEGKKRFFEILFSKPSESLLQLFGASNWITWVNSYKRQKIDLNPTTEEKRHNNVAWLLQTTEVKLMRQVWDKLNRAGIPFLSVHDEIIIRERDKAKAEGIFREVLQREFVYFKLNSKGSGPEEQASDIKPAQAFNEDEERPYKHFFDDHAQDPDKGNWKQQAAALEQFFQAVTMPAAPVKIDPCTTVNNPAEFVSRHLDALRQGGPVRIVAPFLHRLNLIKTVLQNG